MLAPKWWHVFSCCSTGHRRTVNNLATDAWTRDGSATGLRADVAIYAFLMILCACSRRLRPSPSPCPPPAQLNEGVYIMDTELWSSQKVAWYRGTRAYSRRELTSDFIVHLLGISVSTAAVAHLQWRLSTREQTLDTRTLASLLVYSASYPLLWLCSSAYNMSSGRALHKPALLDRLKLLDHVAINLMIAGTYTPLLVQSGCFTALLLLWFLATLNVIHKAVTHQEIGVAHVLVFLLMGWQIIFVWHDVATHLPPISLRFVQVGGFFYTFGLLPFSCGQLEFHTAGWHVCVFIASGCMHVAVEQTVALTLT